jgi:hypothetical protein
MKTYLLIAGDNYYPSIGTGDWIGCFETYEEAFNQIEELPDTEYHEYKIGDNEYHWYDIIDLMDWMNR